MLGPSLPVLRQRHLEEGCRQKKKASRAPSTVSRSTHAWKEHPWLLDVLGVEKRERKKLIWHEDDGSPLLKQEWSWKTSISRRRLRRRSLTQKRRPTSVRLWTSCIAREKDAALKPGGGSPDHITVILGNRRTMTHKGMAYDAFQGRGAHVRSNRFCARYGFQKSMRFSVTLFGDTVACSLATAWCSTLHFFFDEFQDSENDRHVF